MYSSSFLRFSKCSRFPVITKVRPSSLLPVSAAFSSCMLMFSRSSSISFSFELFFKKIKCEVLKYGKNEVMNWKIIEQTMADEICRRWDARIAGAVFWTYRTRNCGIKANWNRWPRQGKPITFWNVRSAKTRSGYPSKPYTSAGRKTPFRLPRPWKHKPSSRLRIRETRVGIQRKTQIDLCCFAWMPTCFYWKKLMIVTVKH